MYKQSEVVTSCHCMAVTGGGGANAAGSYFD